MYRNLALVAVLLLTLTACNNDKAKQAEHTSAEAPTTLAHAIAVQPAAQIEVQPAEVQPLVSIDQEPVVGAEGNQPDETGQTDDTSNVAVAAKEILYTTSIVSVQLENNFGPVFVPHSLHVELYDCAACHGEGVPGKIDKTKKQFHSTCRGCHAKIEAGPTKCNACHQRTK